MANRYWVGGSDTWDNTAGTKWASTSGGTGGVSVPTFTDDVFLDAASGSVTVTLGPYGNTQLFTLSLDCTGFNGTIDGSGQLRVYGSVTMSVSMSNSFNGQLDFLSNGVLTSSGKSIYRLNAQSGTVTLADAYDGDTVYTYGGTFDTAGYTTSIKHLYVAYTPFICNNSTINLQELNVSQFFDAGTSNITFNPPTSFMLGGSSTISGSTASFYNVTIDMTYLDFPSLSRDFSISGTRFTFNNLSIISGLSASAPRFISTSQLSVFGTFSCIGTQSSPVIITSGGTSLFKRGGNNLYIEAQNTHLTRTYFGDVVARDTAYGATTWNGIELGNMLGNTGINFENGITQSWAGSGGSWSSVSSWSSSRIPLPQDNIVISQNFSGSTESRTISADVISLGRNIDFSSIGGSPILKFNLNQSEIYGDLILSPNIYIDKQQYYESASFHPNYVNLIIATFSKYDPAGLSMPQSINAIRTVDSRQGIFSLVSDTTFGGELNFSNVEFHTNDKNLILMNGMNNPYILYTGYSTINIRGGSFIINSHQSCPNGNLIFDCVGSFMRFTDTGGSNFNNILINGPLSLEISLSNTTFNNFTIGPNSNIKCPSLSSVNSSYVTSTTKSDSVSSFSASNFQFMVSNSAIIDYVSLYGAKIYDYGVGSNTTFYAGKNSIDNGGNVGWYFGNPPGVLTGIGHLNGINTLFI